MSKTEKVLQEIIDKEHAENERLRWGIEEALRALDHAHDGSVIPVVREILQRAQG